MKVVWPGMPDELHEQLEAFFHRNVWSNTAVKVSVSRGQRAKSKI